MKVSIIGAGAMGGSIARGLLSSQPSIAEITVSNPTPAKLIPLRSIGALTTLSNVDALALCPDVIIICVKPWFVEKVIKELKPHINYNNTEISVVAAGISVDTLSGWLKKDGAGDQCVLPQFCISIPNTAVSECQSMTFQVNGPDSDCQKTLSLFDRLGKTLVIEEKQLQGATALASCGIAYAMRYVRAAMEGGVELGFKSSAAQEIIVQTLTGAVSLLSQPGSHPETEIDKVTTPGGITIRGLNAMEQSGFTPAVINGLRASCL